MSDACSVDRIDGGRLSSGVMLLMQVVNAFSVQTDAEMKAKVITRLCNMTELHQLLNRSLAGKMTSQQISCW